MERLINANRLAGDLYVETKKANEKLGYYEIEKVIERQPVIPNEAEFLKALNNSGATEIKGLIIYGKEHLLENLENEFQRLKKERDGK